MTQYFTASPVNTLVERQREFFQTGQPRSIAFCLKQLSKLKQAIIDHQETILQVAKRIAWGKLINAGQTSIVPDYLLVHRQIKDGLVDRIKHYIKEFYGEKPAQSPDYGRIIHRKHFDRLIAFLDRGEIILGGDYDPDDRYIAPTLIDGVTWDDPVMREEIFGPILPILTYDDLEDAISQVNAHPKPLALYFFSSDPQKQERILQATSSGGVCINDTVMQVGVSSLPFGGVGESGMGVYHGKASFDTFSHYKSVLKRGFWLDLNWRYAPYTAQKLKQIKGIVTG
jgi:aldehyde dehydrogenase (NAD+)